MNTRILLGEHTRLTALTSDSDISVMKRWTAHAASWRLLDTPNDGGFAPEYAERESGERAGHFYFLIYPLSGEQPIGQAALFGIRWPTGEAWLTVGFGDREAWNERYGVDALKVLLRFAFGELNLRRVRLGVFDYDARAIRSYEEAGFAIEGRMLQVASRNAGVKAGVYMGLQRESWELPSAV
ncbi:MAG TPA: GNAT family protein [Anaerolineae bacterium]